MWPGPFEHAFVPPFQGGSTRMILTFDIHKIDFLISQNHFLISKKSILWYQKIEFVISQNMCFVVKRHLIQFVFSTLWFNERKTNSTTREYRTVCLRVVVSVTCCCQSIIHMLKFKNFKDKSIFWKYIFLWNKSFIQSGITVRKKKKKKKKNSSSWDDSHKRIFFTGM